MTSSHLHTEHCVMQAADNVYTSTVWWICMYFCFFFLCPQMIYYSYKQIYEWLIFHNSVFHRSHKPCGEKKSHVIKSLTCHQG